MPENFELLEIISLFHCGNVKYRTVWLENSMGGGILFLSLHEHEASTHVKVFLGIGKKIIQGRMRVRLDWMGVVLLFILYTLLLNQ